MKLAIDAHIEGLKYTEEAYRESRADNTADDYRSFWRVLELIKREAPDLIPKVETEMELP